MTNDLEKRVNEVREWQESDTTLIGTRWDNWEISKIEPTPRETEFARLIFDLQDEINRLKSGQVRLKKPEELKKYYKNRRFDHLLVRHRMVSERWSLMSQDDMLNKCQNGDKVIGFIALSDLPTEIEVKQ